MHTRTKGQNYAQTSQEEKSNNTVPLIRQTPPSLLVFLSFLFLVVSGVQLYQAKSIIHIPVSHLWEWIVIIWFLRIRVWNMQRWASPPSALHREAELCAFFWGHVWERHPDSSLVYSALFSHHPFNLSRPTVGEWLGNYASSGYSAFVIEDMFCAGLVLYIRLVLFNCSYYCELSERWRVFVVRSAVQFLRSSA